MVTALRAAAIRRSLRAAGCDGADFGVRDIFGIVKRVASSTLSAAVQAQHVTARAARCMIDKEDGLVRTVAGADCGRFGGRLCGMLKPSSHERAALQMFRSMVHVRCDLTCMSGVAL